MARVNLCVARGGWRVSRGRNDLRRNGKMPDWTTAIAISHDLLTGAVDDRQALPRARSVEARHAPRPPRVRLHGVISIDRALCAAPANAARRFIRSRQYRRRPGAGSHRRVLELLVDFPRLASRAGDVLDLRERAAV